MSDDERPGASALLTGETLPPAFRDIDQREIDAAHRNFAEAVSAWLKKYRSLHTHDAYKRDFGQFLEFIKIKPEEVGYLVTVRPEHIAAWRESLEKAGGTNATVRRKLTAIRSLFSYLQTYGHTGANPAHPKFVQAPSVSREGKTVALTPQDCRRLLDAPKPTTPVGVRDRAVFAVLAYTACRVDELVRLCVKDLKKDGVHHVLGIYGKGGKERVVPLHLEAVERIEAWLAVPGIADDPDAPLFRAPLTSRGMGKDGFRCKKMSIRAIEYLVERFVKRLRLDPAVTVHSLRVTALTTARERGSDILGLQNYAGHADPRTTLTYIRKREGLSKSPAYAIKYSGSG